MRRFDSDPRLHVLFSGSVLNSLSGIPQHMEGRCGERVYEQIAKSELGCDLEFGLAAGRYERESEDGAAEAVGAAGGAAAKDGGAVEGAVDA